MLKPPRKPTISSGFAAALKSDWRVLARGPQLPPADFSIWLFLAGRGSGKTWAHSHFVHEQAATGAAKRIAIVGATADAVRFTQVEGAAGILAAAGAWERPTYESGKGQITWPSGAIARLFSADSPELLRGPEHDLAWCDELASWRRAQETWDNLMMGLRSGPRPQVVISTTPKPTKLIKDLVAREGADGIVITRSSTYDNRINLPPSFFAQLVKKYEGSRVGRQELLAELLLDVPGALWSHANLQETRVEVAPPMQRVVVAVDPSGSGNENADEAGIVVAGVDAAGEAYCLADLSGRMAPVEWARKAIDAYHFYKANLVIAETNFGAQMVIDTLAAVDPNVPTKAITSSRGKVLRAEPISTYFEQGRGHLCGSFPALEDELTSFTADYDRSRDGSPNRVDALVFAFSELLLNQPLGGYFRLTSLLVNGEPAPLPVRPDSISVTLALTDRTDSALGVIYWARSRIRGIPVTILDYDLIEVDAALADGYLQSVNRRASILAELTQARIRIPTLWVEKHGIGETLLRQGQHAEINIRAVPKEMLLPTLDERAIACKGYVQTSRFVKLAQEAHERILVHRSVSVNHLISQLTTFELGGKDQAAELVNAFCIGLAVSLENSHGHFALSKNEVTRILAPPIEEPPVITAEQQARIDSFAESSHQMQLSETEFKRRAILEVARGNPYPRTLSAVNMVGQGWPQPPYPGELPSGEHTVDDQLGAGRRVVDGKVCIVPNPRAWVRLGF